MKEKEEEKICDNCAHQGMGFHKVNNIRTYTFECQSFDSPKRGRRVKLTDTCSCFFSDRIVFGYTQPISKVTEGWLLAWGL